MERTAKCPCGQLSITVVGDPLVVVACNCTNCQRKSGSVFNVVSSFKNEQIVSTEGEFNEYELAGDSGRNGKIKFCPTCGTSVYWNAEAYQACTSIAVGCFADPGFPAPEVSLWNKSKHEWVIFPENMPCLETQLSKEALENRLNDSPIT